MADAAVPARSAAPRRLPALDGLRALAILLVLMTHLMPGRNSSQGLESLVFKIADVGWSGVDLFFVLSGFLITGILLRCKDEGRGLASFWFRRVMRILPLYYLTLAFIFLVAPLLLRIYPVPSLSFQGPFWLYVNNFGVNESSFSGGVFAVGHFWSLAVEMQFYLAWPFLVQFLPERRITQVAVLLLILALAGRWLAVVLEAPWSVTFFWTPLRYDGLLAGALVAILARRAGRAEGARVRWPVFALALAGAGFLFAVAWTGRGSVVFKGEGGWDVDLLRVILPSVLAATFGACLWICLHRNFVSRVMAWKAFEPIARFSYAIYVFHFLFSPLFETAFGPAVLSAWVGGGDAGIYLYFFLASTLSFTMAAVSYHLFESHFLKFDFHSGRLTRRT